MYAIPGTGPQPTYDQIIQTVAAATPPGSPIAHPAGSTTPTAPIIPTYKTEPTAPAPTSIAVSPPVSIAPQPTGGLPAVSTISQPAPILSAPPRTTGGAPVPAISISQPPATPSTTPSNVTGGTAVPNSLQPPAAGESSLLGGLAGAAAGFLTGGPIGAVTGGILGLTGSSSSSSSKPTTCPSGTVKIGTTCYSTSPSAYLPGGTPATSTPSGMTVVSGGSAASNALTVGYTRSDKPITLGGYTPTVKAESVRRCPKMMVLAIDGNCYYKKVLPRAFRLHKPRPKPLVSGADVKAIRRADRTKKRVERVGKQVGLHVYTTARSRSSGSKSKRK